MDSESDGYQKALQRIEVALVHGWTSLNLSGLGLVRVPGGVWFLRDLEELHFDGNQLASLPESIGQLQNLTRLHLDGNQLTSLPESIGQLRNLTTLRLNDNQLTSLPDSIGQLQNLAYLNLSNNQLASLPKGIGQLESLTGLYLHTNQLTSLPDSIGQLQKLTDLGLFSNQLASLPESVGWLQNLADLGLSDNQLTSLPESIGQLRNLTTLRLSDNQLTSLPDSIGQLQNLGHYSFSSNPLVSPPVEIANQGIDAIRSWFAANRESAPRPLHEVRLLFVGEGASGKTSLIRRLLGEGFNEGEAQTQGIEIHNHGVQVHKAQQNEIRLHFWDFGGQEVMHSTHQFFLSHRSLYVVVLDGRADPRTEYWLQHAASFGGGSPILVVLNKIDTNPSFDVNRAFLLEKYPNILGFHRLSCKTDEGLYAFREALYAALSEVEMTESQWPGRWFDVKQRLENHEADYLDSDAFEELCEAAQLTDSEQREVLLKYLHDLGVAIHFQDFNLADLHVLKPYWITEAVYRIINARDLDDLGRIRDPVRRTAASPCRST